MLHMSRQITSKGSSGEALATINGRFRGRYSIVDRQDRADRSCRMAVNINETERNPLSSDIGHVPCAELILEELQTPESGTGNDRPLDGVDLITEEHDSLLHADKLSVPVSNVPKHVPWFAWALLAASLVAVASAAVVFASIKDVPTFALAAWRLQLTTVLLSPAAFFQYSKLSSGAAFK